VTDVGLVVIILEVVIREVVNVVALEVGLEVVVEILPDGLPKHPVPEHFRSNQFSTTSASV
jgi:hypothetical protein